MFYLKDPTNIEQNYTNTFLYRKKKEKMSALLFIISQYTETNIKQLDFTF